MLATAASSASPDAIDVLWQHRQHIFIFTSAGKPIFSQHGKEEQLSPLFALLRILLHAHEEEEDTVGNQGGGPHDTPHASASPTDASPRATGVDEVRQVVFYTPRRDEAGSLGSVEGEEVQALTFFVYLQGEIMYVMVVRSVSPVSSLATTEHAPVASEEEPPPVAGHCAAQLRHLHHSLLLVLPTINALLRKSPGLDVMATYTSADRMALRELIESYHTDQTYAAGAMATAPLTVARRHVVEDALLRCYRAEVDVTVGPPAHQLFSFVYYKHYVVAMVGPPETYAADPGAAEVVPLAFGREDARCGGLHVDDTLLLYRYARSLVKRQAGEAWVPVCLPHFNGAGYLWCYAVNLTRHARDVRQQQQRSVWPRLWDEDTEQDMLLLHISASQDDFMPLSRLSRQFVELLYVPAVADDFFHGLEEELCYGAPAPLTELLALSCMPLSSAPSPSLPDGVGAAVVPLWYGLTLQDSDPALLADPKRGEAKAAAAASRRATASIRLLLESCLSPLLAVSTTEEVKQFRQRVWRALVQLRALPSSPSSPSMLWIRDSASMALALVQPTPATLTTLARHFFSPGRPFDIPDSAVLGEQADLATSFGAAALDALPQQGASFASWVKMVQALGVVELAVALPATTPEAVAWYWVAHILFMAVRRHRRFVVRQLIGRERVH